jgi:fucose permease
MGLQMASAYAGTTIMPPLFGAVAEHVGIALFPFILLLLVVAMRTMTELVNRIHARAIDRPQRGDESASLRVSS